MENWRKKGRKEDSKQQMSSARLELGHIRSVSVSKPYAHQNIESALRPIIYAGGWRVQPRSAAHPFSTYSGLAIFTSVWPIWDSRCQNVVTRRSCGSQLNSCAGVEKKFLLNTSPSTFILFPFQPARPAKRECSLSAISRSLLWCFVNYSFRHDWPADWITGSIDQRARKKESQWPLKPKVWLKWSRGRSRRQSAQPPQGTPCNSLIVNHHIPHSYCLLQMCVLLM